MKYSLVLLFIFDTVVLVSVKLRKSFGNTGVNNNNNNYYYC